MSEPTKAMLAAVEDLMYGDHVEGDPAEIWRRMEAAEQAEVTRFEVIDRSGRVYVSKGVRVALSFQDDGRTLKVFVNGVGEGAEEAALIERRDSERLDYLIEHAVTSAMHMAAVLYEPQLVLPSRAKGEPRELIDRARGD